MNIININKIIFLCALALTSGNIHYMETTPSIGLLNRLKTCLGFMRRFQPRVIDFNNPKIIEHHGCVKHVAFSPCGRFLATTSYDHTCQIYDLINKKTIDTIQHDDVVKHVAFSPCGRFLATTSNDNSCKIYESNT